MKFVFAERALSPLVKYLTCQHQLHGNAWAAHNSLLYDQHLVAVKEELQTNQDGVTDPERKEEGQSTPISVCFDCTWPERGFTSNHGVGIVISTETGNVLDNAVESKTCNLAQYSKRNYQSKSSKIGFKTMIALVVMRGLAQAWRRPVPKTFGTGVLRTYWSIDIWFLMVIQRGMMKFIVLKECVMIVRKMRRLKC